jgi:hypothetical protein
MQRRDFIARRGGRGRSRPVATDLKPATREIDGLLWGPARKAR